MSMFDGLIGSLGNLDEVAGKLGIPPETAQSLAQAVQEKVSTGDFAGLADVAQQHGISLDMLQGLVGGAGNPQEMLGKMAQSLDKDGDGNPMNDLGGIVSGLFNKS